MIPTRTRSRPRAGFHGKTEAWYILHAAPGTDLIHGLAHAGSRDELAGALADGSLLSLLRRVPARAGNTIFVPAGRYHAINAGIMLFEIQQKSDLTYRVYDYDRRDAQGRPRALHIERALDVTSYDAAPPAVVEPKRLDGARTLLVSAHILRWSGWIWPRRWRRHRPWQLRDFDGDRRCGKLAWADGAQRLARGELIVLPAGPGAYRWNLIRAPRCCAAMCRKEPTGVCFRPLVLLIRLTRRTKVWRQRTEERVTGRATSLVFVLCSGSPRAAEPEMTNP